MKAAASERDYGRKRCDMCGRGAWVVCVLGVDDHLVECPAHHLCRKRPPREGA